MHAYIHRYIDTSILYHTIPYYTILYHTIPYHTIHTYIHKFYSHYCLQDPTTYRTHPTPTSTGGRGEPWPWGGGGVPELGTYIFVLFGSIYDSLIPIYTYTYIYIYSERYAVRSPFSTFLKMQCFCYIMFNPLCSYTCDGIARDPHRLSDFLRGCQRMYRESWRSPGKRKEEKQT